MGIRRPISMEEEATLLDESGEAAYCRDWIDDEGNKTCKVYSTYQRNEIAQRWQRKDGSIFITVRTKTRKEAEAVRKKHQEALDQAIKDGRAVKDRVGRIKWIKR